jgi:hypothetical protein
MLRLFPVLLLAITSAQASAQEVAVGLDGVAFPADQSTQAGVPFDITFLLNSASGAQSYIFGTGPCMQEFQISGVSISHFVANVGGKTVANAPSLLGSFGGPNVQGGCAGYFDLTFDMPQVNFTAELLGIPVPSKTQFASWNDPLASMLTEFSYRGESGSLPSWNLDVTSIRVPEPDAFALMALGLCAVFGAFLLRHRSS